MNDSGPEGLPPPESFSRCDRSVDRSVPVPEPNLKSMASLRASSMMSSMLSLHALDEAGRALRILVRVLRLLDVVGLRVPVPVALRALDAVLVVQADVEPDGRIERPVLVQAEPGQVAIEPLAVLGRGEVAVFACPSRRSCGRRDGSTAARCSRARGVFDFAVEVLADHDVGGQLAPRGGNFAVGLLEQHLAPFALDGGGARSHWTVSNGSATSSGQKIGSMTIRSPPAPEPRRRDMFE